MATVKQLRQTPQSTSLSARIWGLDWQAHLPLRLSGDIFVEESSYEECARFAAEHFQRIYAGSAGSPFLWLDPNPAREFYYRTVGDFFSFKEQGKIIGIHVFTVHDWSTYYIRNTAILPEYQDRKLFQQLYERLVASMRGTSVERVVAETSITNPRVIHLLQKVGFIQTGMNLSERWGSMVQLTHFISDRHAGVFARQFCHGSNSKKGG